MLVNRQQSELAASDLQHRFAKLISVGTVEEVDYELARVTVRIGEWLTAKLPWLTSQAAQDMTWQAPEVGEQVIVLSPCGDTAQGVVLGSLYANSHQQPHHKMTRVTDATSAGGSLVQALQAVAPESREHVQRTRYQDGAIVQYDRENHAYDIFVPSGEDEAPAKINIYSGGDINIECQNNASIHVGNNADVKVLGETQVLGEKNVSITALEALNLQGKSVNITSTDDGTNIVAKKGAMAITTEQGGITVTSEAEALVESKAGMAVKATGTLKLDGATIAAQGG
ncbi:hypothetical protein A7985_22590 [Pseudoalteromonas luteoviolacea]|uniref:Gp5/Type VI secretion system Vgr protein OB-fold domain-containing protein n=1 Tax=Pseudoalteromonas luteoviolacea TaxID=43657 RepID=A0A1C0TKB2_9GAMM|nr:phage baseplate assembly protein V [Pseudoalteromonas luteoviolacea]OCQ18972.1 hypothetical protein A7985_22590 [Pseudoalteromonas luteoviolacea]